MLYHIKTETPFHIFLTSADAHRWLSLIFEHVFTWRQNFVFHDVKPEGEALDLLGNRFLYLYSNKVHKVTTERFAV